MARSRTRSPLCRRHVPVCQSSILPFVATVIENIQGERRGGRRYERVLYRDRRQDVVQEMEGK